MVNLNRILVCIFIISLSNSAYAYAQQQTLLDPMRPQHYQAPTASALASKANTESWTLTTILISSARQVAVINGHPFQEGDTLDGYNIVEIHPNRVVLKKKKSKIILRRSGTGLRKDIPKTER